MRLLTVSHLRRSRTALKLASRTAASALAALVLGASTAQAQVATGSPMHLSATSRISAAVQPILSLSDIQIATVQSSATESTVGSRVLVRSNLPYRLAVRAAAVLSGQQGTVVVRDQSGAWVPLSNDRAVVVGESDAGVATHDVSCRVVANHTSAAGSTAAVDAQSCSLAYELAPRNDAGVLAAVAVVLVPSTALSAAGAIDRR